MGLKGDLSTFSLAEVFQLIASSAKEGTLEVSDEESRKVIYFSKNGIKLLSSGKRKGLPLGELLLRAGVITQAQLNQALEHQKKTSLRLGEILRAFGFIKEDDIQRAVRSQIEEEIYDLFTWQKASFEFKEGSPPAELLDPENPVTALNLDANALVFEAARRIDEWELIRKHIPHTFIIFAQTEQAESVQHRTDTTQAARVVLPLVNGLRTVEEIVRDSHLGNLEASKAVYALLTEGVIREVTFNELKENARLRLAHKDYPQAYLLYQQAITLNQVQGNPEDLSLQENMAEVLEGLERTSEAAGVYQALGDLLNKNGEVEKAIIAYQKAAHYLPEDAGLAEKFLDLYFGKKDATKIIETGKHLLKLYQGQKDLAKAKALTEQLVLRCPSELDFELRTYIAKVYYELGDYIRSREEIQVAIHQVGSRKIQDLMAAYEEILRVEPHHADARYQLDLLKAEQERRQRRKRLLVGLISAGVVLLVIIIIGIRYELNARSELARLNTEISQLLTNHNHQEAREKCQKFSYPLTIFNRGALNQLKVKINSEEKTYQEAQQRLASETLAQMEKTYQTLRTQEETTVNLRELLSPYQDLLTRAEAKGKDYQNLANEIRRRMDYINNYLKEADALAQTAQALDKNNQMEESYRTIVKLIRNYPKSPAALAAKLPVQITSEPAGVNISVDGQPQGITPLKIYLSLDSLRSLQVKPTVTIALNKRGFKPYTAAIKPTEHPSFNFILEKNVRWTFSTAGIIENKGVVSENTFYITSRGGYLYALDVESGDLRWQVRSERGADFTTSPLILRDLIILGTSDGYLYTISANSRRKVWEYKICETVTTPLVVSSDGSIIYLGGSDKNAYAVEISSGKILWSFPVGARISAGIIFNQDSLYLVNEEGTLYCLNRGTGSLSWKTSIDDTVRTTPLLVNDFIYVSGLNRVVYAVNLTEKQVKWRAKTTDQIITTPFFYKNRLYIASEDGILYILDTRKGDWIDKVKTEGITTAVSFLAETGIIYLGKEDGSLYALDTKDNKILWKYKTSGKITATPVSAGELIIIATMSRDRNILAVEQ